MATDNGFFSTLFGWGTEENSSDEECCSLDIEEIEDEEKSDLGAAASDLHTGRDADSASCCGNGAPASSSEPAESATQQ
ncbi:hypothetical protein [Salinibacter altiplanensis]|uniref:hypothetical protein n=1 Tax=Salinibacter altiplanensis TaxID=1803181 RepID=UPI000C9F1DE2|nr:hypothetical protein [Salinibacter altiplanensis]